MKSAALDKLAVGYRSGVRFVEGGSRFQILVGGCGGVGGILGGGEEAPGGGVGFGVGGSGFLWLGGGGGGGGPSGVGGKKPQEGVWGVCPRGLDVLVE